MVYITLNCGLLRYDVWTIEKLFFEGRVDVATYLNIFDFLYQRSICFEVPNPKYLNN